MYLLDHHEADEGIDFIRENLVEDVGIVFESDAEIRSHVLHVHVLLVDVHHKFAFGVNFDEYLSER